MALFVAPPPGGGSAAQSVSGGEVTTTVDLAVSPYPDSIVISNYDTDSVIESWDFTMGPTKFFLFNAPSRIYIEIKKVGYLGTKFAMSLNIGGMNSQTVNLQQYSAVALIVRTYTSPPLSSVTVEKYQSGGPPIPPVADQGTYKTWELSPGVEYEILGRDSGGVIAVDVYVPAHQAGERVEIDLADYLQSAYLAFHYLDKDNIPVVGRAVTLKRAGVLVDTRNTDGSGTAVFELLPYTEYAWAVNGFSGKASTGAPSSTTNIQVNPDAGKGGGGLLGSIVAHITDSNGNNLEAATVVADALGGISGSYITGPDGVAYFNDKFLPMATVRITAYKGEGPKAEKTVTMPLAGGAIVRLDMVVALDGGGGGGGGGGGDEPAFDIAEYLPYFAVGGLALVGVWLLSRQKSDPAIVVGG